MSWHRYETQSLVADYARSAAGTSVCGGLLLVSDLLPLLAYVLATLTALFGTYGVRTLMRHFIRLQVDDDGLRLWLGGRALRELPWESVQEVKIRYFSTRRDGADGWLQMVVSGGGRTIRCDSHLDDFRTVVEQACRAADQARVPLCETTVANLRSLGLAREAEAPL